MPIDTELHRAAPAELFLDEKNPRLGRLNTARGLSQAQILDLMSGWSLEELAASFLENGFWPQEALIAVREDGRLVVVEGNRRLAALKQLLSTRGDATAPRRWRELVENATQEQFDRLATIPYLLAPNRAEIDSYLGFRHVTGIKQWHPAEKAEYIAHLIDDLGMSYRDVARRIGSKIPTVRQHYIAFRLLLQMEDEQENIPTELVEKKFSVLYLSLRAAGVQGFLNLNPRAEPPAAHAPVPPDRLENLVKYSRWLFGDDRHEPVISDSRQVDRFGKVLENAEAVEYLDRTDEPNLETAYRKTGGDEHDVITVVQRGADAVEEALTSAHRFVGSVQLQKAVRRLGLDALQLIRIFPPLQAELLEAGDAPAA